MATITPPKVLCINCKHYCDDDDNPFAYPVCKASPEPPRYSVIDGHQVNKGVYEACGDVNNGNCQLYEQRPAEQPVDVTPWLTTFARWFRRKQGRVN